MAAQPKLHLPPGEDEVWTLDDLRREIQIGVDAADRGELIDGEEVFAELLAEFDDLPPDAE